MQFAQPTSRAIPVKILVVVNEMQKGFTLVEIILYVGIMAIVFSAIVPFTWSVIENGSKSAVQQEVFDNARFISEKIKFEVLRASGIATVSANSLSLTDFAPDTTTVIDLSGGNVRINKNGGGAVNLNSQNVAVSDLTFTNYSSTDNRTKNVDFTLTASESGVRQEFHSSISIRGSAEVRSN